MNDSKSPKISVVLPVKGCESYIDQSLQSVLSQKYIDFELIIVCDRHYGNLFDISQSNKKIIYLIQTKEGISEAFNEGIQKARGEFVAFQSADDIWHKDKLSIQYEYMTANLEVQYTITKFRYFLDKSSPVPEGFKKELLNKDIPGPTLESFMCRKNLFNRLGFFDTDFSSALDIEWFSRLNNNSIKSFLIPEILLYKRIHNANISLNEQSNNKQIINALRLSINKKRSKNIN